MSTFVINSDGSTAVISSGIQGPPGVTGETGPAGPAGEDASITLTTTGTSGAATLSSGVLNIPNYAGGVTSVFTRTGAVVAASGDYTVSQVTGAAPLASPTFTGTPAAPTAAGGTNTTQIATTAFVASAVGSLAPIASPTFTGTPAAPTATAGTNTTQLATTAFVTSAVAGYLPITGGTLTGALSVASTAASPFNLLNVANSGSNWASFTVQANGSDIVFYSANPYIGNSAWLSIAPSVYEGIADLGPGIYVYGLGFSLASTYPNSASMGGFIQGGPAGTMTISNTKAGTDSVSLKVIGTLNVSSTIVCSELETTQTPTASSTASDHSVPIVLNGTTYYMRLSTTA